MTAVLFTVSEREGNTVDLTCRLDWFMYIVRLLGLQICTCYARHFPFLEDASSSKAGTQRSAFELGNLPQRDDLSNLRDRSAERRRYQFHSAYTKPH